MRACRWIHRGTDRVSEPRSAVLPRRGIDPRQRGRAPQPYRAIGASGGQEVAVGGEGHAHDGAAMAGQRRCLLIDAWAPEPDGAIPGSRGQGLAIGREGDGGDRSEVRPRPVGLLPGGPVPEMDRAIPISSGHELTVGRELQGQDVGHSFQGGQLTVGGDIPEGDMVVRASDRDRFAVGGERDGGHGPTRVRRKDGQRFAGSHVPEPDRGRHAPGAAAVCGDEDAAGRKAQALGRI
jgi:hypothetical protein